ncbi:hypothetical protein GCM10007916_12670 [Psychromonas marina]|uniref:Uncharacterized protein n=1 Tax=Psychromonas marina TaxID=88364 RepID=A0ABQ6DYZ0_9GAMM|nr:hypothetical protein [Psychromonas marina]GLS90200.1 hypothetical protein GCM10007916_12670 [Psychromonas marina]
MSSCSELTIFKVSKENIPKVIALSLLIIDEINANETVITSHNILQKTDNEEELCWHLTWINKEAAQLNTEKWPNLPSTKALMSLVGEKVYYGHFVDVA